MIQRMPRLLDGAMQARERLNPVRANVQMNLTPLSTASLTLPPDAPEVSARDFIELYAPDQSLGIFRATSVRTVYGDQRQVTLEEGICTLEDDLTAEDTVLNGGMQAVLETLLTFQTNKRWVLGTIASEAQFTDVEAARVNVLEAVLQAVAADDTVMLVRDYSHTPWVLNVVKKREDVSCECRLNRNLNNVTATLDDSALCTHVTVVPDEGEAFEMDADTVNTWGVVHREITVEEGKDPEAEARKYLEAHKNPALSVECDALALAELTGEAWDSFALGQLCAVVLPDFGVVLRERIVTVYYSDLFADPRHVRLTLSTQAADASSALASLGAATKSNSNGLSRAFKHITETENAVLIQAEQISLRATKEELAEINGTLTDKISQVSIDLDAANAQLRLKANQEYVDQQFSATELLLDGANARIDAEAKRIDEANGEISSAKLAIDGANAAITAEVKRASEAEGELTGKLEVTTEAITAEVTRATGAEEELAGRIKITEDSITEQAGKIDAQGKLISGAEERIDGLNKTITDVAGDVDTLTGDLSGVRTELDGANKKITEQAGKIDDQGKMIEGVQLVLNGAEGEAGLVARMKNAESALTVASDEIKAEVKRATEKEGEMSASIKANADAIELRATKTEFDALGNRVSTAETKITQNADAIELRATKKEVEDVTASLKVESDRITSVVGDVAGHTEWLTAVDGVVQSHTTAIQQNAKDVKSVTDDLAEKVKWVQGIETVVQTHTTSINQNKDAIALKADSTVVDGINKQVTENKAAIEVNAEAIKNMVTKTEYDTLSGRVTSLNTTVTQSAGKIETLITSTDDLNEKIYGTGSGADHKLGLMDKVNGYSYLGPNGETVVETGITKRLSTAEQKVTETAESYERSITWLTEVDRVVTTHTTAIQQNAKDITLRATKEEMNAAIKVESDRITSVVGDVDAVTDDLAAKVEWVRGIETVVINHGTLISQTMDEISQKVAKGSIISEINQTAETIKISASKINLEGYVTATALTTNYLTATYLASTVGSILSAYAGKLSAENLHFDSAVGLEATINDLTSESIYSTSISGDHIYAGEIDLGTHYHTFTPNPDGTITIGGPSATAGSFKIADTQFYKDGVSAAINSVTLKDPVWRESAVYTNQAITVNASNGKSKTAYVYLTQGSWSSGTKPVYLRSDSSSGTIRARVNVDMPETAVFSKPAKQSSTSTSVTFTINCIVGGKTYTSNNITVSI